MAKVIILDGVYVEKEAPAAAAITPGHLVEFDGATNVKKHATAAGNARKAFALQPYAASGATIDTAYAAGETVRYALCPRGVTVNALVAAAATAIAKGAALESAGDGTLRTASADAATDTTQRDSIVGYALEAVDNSAGAAVVRIQVEVV
jgi:hypothetical protein